MKATQGNMHGNARQDKTAVIDEEKSTTIKILSCQDNARQAGKATQGKEARRQQRKAKQCTATQDKARQDKTRQGKKNTNMRKSSSKSSH